MKEKIGITILAVITGLLNVSGEEVHMGYWNGCWNVVRKQQADSAYAEFRRGDEWIAHTTNIFEAVQTAYDKLPAHPSGSAWRNLVWVRNFTNSSHTVNVDDLTKKCIVLRDRHSVHIDFDRNTFVFNGGTGEFINANGINGLQIKKITIHSNPHHTGNTVIFMHRCDNTYLENINCHRNGEGGIGIRMEGSPGHYWMHNAHLAGDFNFSGGRWDKWGIEFMTINGLNVGNVDAKWSAGSAVCVNNSANTYIGRVEGYRLSYKADAAYGVLRYANECYSNRVGTVKATECGRALATVTSPSLDLDVDRVEAVNCMEYGAALFSGYTKIYSGYINTGCKKAGVSVAGGSRAYLRWMDIKNIDMTGVELHGNNSTLEGSSIGNCLWGFGVRVQGSGNSVTSTLVNKTGNSALRIDNASQTLVRGSAIINSNQRGIDIHSSAGNTSVRTTSAAGNGWGSSNQSSSTNIDGSSSIDWR